MKRLKESLMTIPDEMIFEICMFLDMYTNLKIMELVCKRICFVLNNRVYNQQVINNVDPNLKKQYLYAQEKKMEIINFLPEKIHNKCSNKRCNNYICKGNIELQCKCCGEYYCIECLRPKKCDICRNICCKNCNALRECNNCGTTICAPHEYSIYCSDNCNICDKVYCSECIVGCECCASPFCRECSDKVCDNSNENTCPYCEEEQHCI